MEKKSKNALCWSPRILAMLFALFISLFALDVFSGGHSLFKMMLAFLIHLIPTWIIIFTIIISWKREWVAAMVFIILGVAYIIMAWGKFPFSVYLLISGPLFIIGILYWLNWIESGSQRLSKASDLLKNHHNRDDLAGEHKFGDAGQATIAILFFLVWFFDTFVYEYTTKLNEIIPNAVRAPIGIIILIVAGYLAISTLRIVFKEVREVSEVIRKGAYNYCRHPMYLSEILLYIGLLLISMSLAAFIVLLLGIGFLYFICRYEERLLLDHFGDEYRQYMREVPMWIPRLRQIIKK